MPNWCFTGITFRGEKENLIKLANNVEKWTSYNAVDNGFGLNWLGNVVINSGIIKANELDTDKSPRCRGSVTYEELHLKDPGDEHYYITTETAWAPMLKMWTMINEKYDLDLEIIYTAEEPGCGIFYTNDPAVAGHYVLDVWEDIGIETNWEASESYVIEVLQELLHTTENNLDKLFEMFYDSEVSENLSINMWEYTAVEELED